MTSQSDVKDNNGPYALLQKQIEQQFPLLIKSSTSNKQIYPTDGLSSIEHNQTVRIPARGNTINIHYAPTPLKICKERVKVPENYKPVIASRLTKCDVYIM